MTCAERLRIAGERLAERLFHDLERRPALQRANDVRIASRHANSPGERGASLGQARADADRGGEHYFSASSNRNTGATRTPSRVT